MSFIHYVTFASILYLLGLWGIFFNRKNVIVMLMSIELMLLAINVNFLVFSIALDDLVGQIFALFILTVAAAESSIGLALLVIYYRTRGTIAVEFVNLMKG
jgi:NADH-quinone oxidoreductase subunit K